MLRKLRFAHIACITVIALLLASTSVTARSKKMLEAAEQSPTPSADKALVVFLRNSFAGSAIQASVYDTREDGQEFFGIVSNKTRVAVEVAPGKHRFMVIAENADFLEADLLAGKTYYVLISPRMGMWKARFSLLPIHSDASAERNVHTADFAKWMEKSVRVERGPEADAWYQANQPSVDKKRTSYLKKWDRMLPADKANLTLLPSDGV